MHITVAKDVLLLALGRAQGIVGKRSTMPILSNILLETVSSDRFSITATDLDIFSQGHYDCLADEQGKICVSAKDLHEITRNLPQGNIDLEMSDGKTLKVVSQKVVYRIRTANVDDYPSMPDFGEVTYTAMEAELLSDLIERTLFSVANDDPRIFLNGVNFERREERKLRLVSTDGHRLSLIDREIANDLVLDHSVIIPRKGMVELKKMLEGDGEEVEVSFAGSNGFFRRDQLFLVMRLIEGEFPDYNMVIPGSTDNIARVDRNAFHDALRRMSILSADRSSGVRFNLKPGELIVESSDPEKGEGREVLEVAYDGAEMSVGFNARYFLDAMAAMSGEQVLLELSDELSPCVVKDSDDEGFLGVVMPIRIT